MGLLHIVIATLTMCLTELVCLDRSTLCMHDLAEGPHKNFSLSPWTVQHCMAWVHIQKKDSQSNYIYGNTYRFLTYISISLYAHIFRSIYIYIHLYLCAGVKCLNLCVHVCTYVKIYVCLCTYVYVSWVCTSQ